MHVSSLAKHVYRARAGRMCERAVRNSVVDGCVLCFVSFCSRAGVWFRNGFMVEKQVVKQDPDLGPRTVPLPQLLPRVGLCLRVVSVERIRGLGAARGWPDTP